VSVSPTELVLPSNGIDIGTAICFAVGNFLGNGRSERGIRRAREREGDREGDRGRVCIGGVSLPIFFFGLVPMV